MTVALCTIGLAGAAAMRTSDKAPASPTQAAEAAGGGAVTVLGYGAIGTAKGALAPAEFRKQMDYLRTSGMKPISLQEFVAWRTEAKPLPQNAVLLTFEDADKEFMASVLPVLREFGFPFLLFVDTKRLSSVQNYMTERDLGMVSRMGGSVGVCNLSPESEKEWQHAELSGNKAVSTLAESELGAPARRLSELAGHECHVFSHFSKNSDVAVLRELVRTGYELAFSRTGGMATRNSPDYLLPRYMVNAQEDFSGIFGLPVQAQQTQTEDEAQPAPSTPPAATHGTTPAPAAATVPAPPPVMEFEDDCVALDDDEPAEGDDTATAQQTGEEDEVEAPLDIIPTDPVTPTYANLGKRTAGGDWVTASFTQPLVPREQTRVAVLGYHNFSNTKTISEMRMRTHEFCQQMQYIREAGLAVISLRDFIEWRLGTRLLPERCVLITIDDGWKSVYTDAYPVLKAYGYPFTIFLYTRYIDVQGDSMTSAQIREMQANGATVGSHSTNHLYPKSWRRLNNDEEAYMAQVQKEILDSGTKLTEKFGPCSAYCYPGGYNTPRMLAALKTSPYRVAFTVLERKVDCTEKRLLVHRYMVFGNDHRIFRRAVNFDGEAGIKPTADGIAAAAATARAFFPKAFEGIPVPEGETAPAADAEAAPAPAEGEATISATQGKKQKGKKTKKGKKR